MASTLDHTLDQDAQFMIQAIQLARLGVYTTSPNPQVGCVLVKDAVVIGKGWHVRAGGAHAEIIALAEAGDRAKGATAYVTLEPCSHFGRTPPCCEALIKSGIKRVVIGSTDTNPEVFGNGIKRLEASGVKVEVSALKSDAIALNPGFNCRMAHSKPYVRSKIAISLDGRTAMQSGESQWITGPEARLDVQKLRARSCIVMTGAGTVRADDCSLTVRLGDWSCAYLPKDIADQTVRQPLRVIVGNHEIDQTAKIFQPQAPTQLVCTGTRPHWLPDHVLHKQIQNEGNDNIDFKALLAYFATEHLANEVLVEAGAGLNGALLAAGVVDELCVYMAPKLLGSAARPLANLNFGTMAEQIQLDIMDLRQVGENIRINLSVRRQ